MGFNEHHMYLRLVQFEFANFKEKVDMPPAMQNSIIPDEMNADRYTELTHTSRVLEILMFKLGFH